MAIAEEVRTERSINVTPKAVSRIREQFAKHGVSGGLRLGVLGGGCSGLSYQFKFDRPFLVMLRKRGTEHPFFVMWVDNAELLQRR